MHVDRRRVVGSVAFVALTTRTDTETTERATRVATGCIQ